MKTTKSNIGYRARLRCNQRGCGGEMLGEDIALRSNPPKYPHVCNVCGEKTLETRVYPYIKEVRVDK